MLFQLYEGVTGDEAHTAPSIATETTARHGIPVVQFPFGVLASRFCQFITTALV